MASEPFEPGQVCQIRGSNKFVRIIEEIKLDALERDGSIKILSGHLYKVEHLTPWQFGDCDNYPGDKLAPQTIKQVSARQHPTKDALLIEDTEGNMLEIPGPETERARGLPNGINTMYLKVVMPNFCKNGEHMEIRAAHNKIVWESIKNLNATGSKVPS